MTAVVHISTEREMSHFQLSLVRISNPFPIVFVWLRKNKMGQGESSHDDEREIDPGPLGDAECAMALDTFKRHKPMTSAKFSTALDLPREFGDDLFRLACPSSTETMSAQRFVSFLGETTRGARSARLTHFLCAAVGVTSLIDDKTGEPRYVERDLVARVFDIAWHVLFSKHHTTLSGFDDDDDSDVTATVRRRNFCAEGGGEPFDPTPFSRAAYEAAEREAAREREAQKEAQQVGSSLLAVDESRIDLSFLARWTNRNAPDLAEAWTAYVRSVVFDDYTAVFTAPVCHESSQIFGDHGNARRAQIFCSLGLVDPSTRGEWTRIYGSGVDGFSFYRLCHQILGWQGPTLLLIKSSKGDVFGAYLDQPWREWHTFYGGSGCFVFSLSPTLQVCRPRRGPGTTRDFMYLNTKGRSKGLCVGSSSGSLETGRIVVPHQLADATVTTRSSCLTFEAGKLTPSSLQEQVDIDALEVWGVGDSEEIAEAIKGRNESRETRNERLRKAGTVDKSKFLASSFDREHILGKTFANCAQDSEYRRGLREEGEGDG